MTKIREIERKRGNTAVLIHNKLPSPAHNMIISKCTPLPPSALTITGNTLTKNN
jgi:hypothetical protein